MIKFKNDYSEGCHQKVLDLLSQTNDLQEEGYGDDSLTKKAVELIQLETKSNPDVFLISAGTQTNKLEISSFLRPHEAVISAESGHIAVHETGAIENTGHKICTIPTKSGKIDASQIQEVMDLHIDLHMVKPRLVYISNPTELGTVYSRKELEELYEYTKNNGLYLYLDGARLGNALMSESDLDMKVINDNSDAFFLGGTKNGALLGEALVISNKELSKDIEYLRKQMGALLAKGRLLGVQFSALFTDDLYYENAGHANEMAKRIRDNFLKYETEFFVDSPTNQIFPILRNDVIEELSKEFEFYVWQAIDEEKSAIRLVTSWATKEKNVELFNKRVGELMG